MSYPAAVAKTTNPPYRFTLWVPLLLFFSWAVLSCTTTQYKQQADREAYATIAEKTPAVPNMEQAFTIDTKNEDVLAGLPTQQETEEALGEMGKAAQGASILSLEKALAIAVTKSRTYQNQKESLYLQALALTLDRHKYTPILAGKASGQYERTTRDVVVVSDEAQLARSAPELVQQIGQLAGTPAEILNAYAQLVRDAGDATGLTDSDIKILDERRVTGGTQVGLNLLLKSGAEAAVSLTSNFLRFVTGNPRVSTSSALVASFTQPLLRGAGSKVAAETLTQAERDLLYELRSFTQFRKEFVVQVASNYYQVLQSRDSVINTYRGYVAFQQAAQRERALAQEGRRTQSELGRIEQALLNSENSWVNAIRSYAEALDRFKILLGLTTDAHVVLAPKELDALRERGLIHPAVKSDEAVQVALATRLDLYTVRDREEDSKRKVEVALNQLYPTLDLVIDGTVNSKPGDRFQELDFERARWSAGLDFNPDFDRKAERNAYRASLISFERAARERELAEDNVKLAVREAWRNLDQAKRNYEIQNIGVQLNERRVEEQTMLSELGRATAQNQVDAQNDLVRARNDLTGALVGHTVARLQFWRDMGILFIKENGQWEEVTDVIKPQ